MALLAKLNANMFMNFIFIRIFIVGWRDADTFNPFCWSHDESRIFMHLNDSRHANSGRVSASHTCMYIIICPL